MEKWLYVMIIKKGKTYNKVTQAVITRHVEKMYVFIIVYKHEFVKKNQMIMGFQVLTL